MVAEARRNLDAKGAAGAGGTRRAAGAPARGRWRGAAVRRPRAPADVAAGEGPPGARRRHPPAAAMRWSPATARISAPATASASAAWPCTPDALAGRVLCLADPGDLRALCGPEPRSRERTLLQIGRLEGTNPTPPK
ncbi:MAG: hypothetical protein MZW92_63780 [Comamonadaceae bacterium]|nr:hypothetical protein [Comamonadaceae bacterium]